MTYLAIYQPNKYSALNPYIQNGAIETEDYIRYMREVSWKLTPAFLEFPLQECMLMG